MRSRDTGIDGCFSFDLTQSLDPRGSFLKIFQLSAFRSKDLDFQPKESFYSVSRKGALRGLHFQVPPKDHDKIVIGLSGLTFDVVFDMRKGSPSYGKWASCLLDGKSPQGLFIPKGCAHGLQALEDSTALLYLTTEEYDPSCDQGIRWDSVESIPWPLPPSALSARDKNFPSWGDFKSPF